MAKIEGSELSTQPYPSRSKAIYEERIHRLIAVLKSKLVKLIYMKSESIDILSISEREEITETLWIIQKLIDDYDRSISIDETNLKYIIDRTNSVQQLFINITARKIRIIAVRETISAITFDNLNSKIQKTDAVKLFRKNIFLRAENYAQDYEVHIQSGNCGFFCIEFLSGFRFMKDRYSTDGLYYYEACYLLNSLPFMKENNLQYVYEPWQEGISSEPECGDIIFFRSSLCRDASHGIVSLGRDESNRRIALDPNMYSIPKYLHNKYLIKTFFFIAKINKDFYRSISVPMLEAVRSTRLKNLLYINEIYLYYKSISRGFTRADKQGRFIGGTEKIYGVIRVKNKTEDL